jgi:hypothetical protein
MFHIEPWQKSDVIYVHLCRKWYRGVLTVSQYGALLQLNFIPFLYFLNINLEAQINLPIHSISMPTLYASALGLISSGGQVTFTK